MWCAFLCSVGRPRQLLQLVEVCLVRAPAEYVWVHEGAHACGVCACCGLSGDMCCIKMAYERGPPIPSLIEFSIEITTRLVGVGLSIRQCFILS